MQDRKQPRRHEQRRATSHERLHCPDSLNYQDSLPVVSKRGLIVETVRENQVTVISGETGSGKTTQLPKMCLEAGRGRRGMIGITQPRRLAATSMASRLAEELGPLGEIVGYKIRFRDRTHNKTRLKFMTDGILLAETQRDRRLRDYDTLIIDEAHERSLNIDFLLGYLKKLREKRPELKVIITSATIDTEKFAAHFSGAPVIEVSGRSWPVEVRYRPDSPAAGEEENSYIDLAVEAVEDIRQRDRPGDILIFMPTERDIQETVEILNRTLRKDAKRGGAPGRPFTVLPLFGRLRGPDQQRIFKPVRGQKIVVATNIAETSLTVPGIRYVIDTGLARIAAYNPRARTTGLPVRRISRAGCDQRLGRCGRVGPGVCIRLYDEEDYHQRPEYSLPEIKRANLAEVILRMLALRLGNPTTFPFVDPPASRTIKDGYALLEELGAVATAERRRRVTERGRLMARFPLDPRIARIIIEARDRNCLREVTVIAAALSIQDPRVRPADHEAEADAVHARFVIEHSDFLSYLKIWDLYHHTMRRVKSRKRLGKFCRSHYLSYQRMREWRDIHQQILAILEEEPGFSPNSEPAPADAVHQAILSGFLRNIAVKKHKNLYQGTRDKEVMLFPGSGIFERGGKWIMAAELVETNRLYARTAADIKVQWLEPLAGSLCRRSHAGPRWEKNRGQVIADEKVTLFGLVIVARRPVNFGKINENCRREAREIFIRSALLTGELKGRYDFLQHNLQLVGQLEELEDRLRQRGVVVDEHQLHRFYEQRLPEEVFDQAGLNRVLKNKGDGHLRMRRRDVLRQEPEDDRLEDFPETLPAGEYAFPLTYRFAPGEEEDGVTVHLPLDAASQVPATVFDWLVPGLLEEKIVHLLKGLPKSIRRRLVPIPQTAAGLLPELNMYQGSLYDALAGLLQKHYGIRPGSEDWPKHSLPDHLRMRFRVNDADGRCLKTGRNLAELLAQAPAEEKPPDLTALRRHWEKDTVIEEDLADIPRRIPIRGAAGRLQGFAYPGLTVEGDDDIVALRLYTDEETARRSTRAALPLLYQQPLAGKSTHLRRECLLPAELWALYEGLGGRKKLHQELYRFVCDELFDARKGLIPSPAEITGRRAAIEPQGLSHRSRQLVGMVMDLLRERRETLDWIRRHEEKFPGGGHRFRSFRDEVARLVPADFLLLHDSGRLVAIRRYLQALRVRVERAYTDPAREAAKVERLRPYEEKLARRRSGDLSPGCRQQLDEFAIMLEEFRVSLFAQELKTAMPVSEKRLDRKWREVLTACDG